MNNRINEARTILLGLEDNHSAIGDYANVIQCLTEGREVSDMAVEGLFRIAGLMRDHAQAISEGIEEARLLLAAEPALKVVSG